MARPGGANGAGRLRIDVLGPLRVVIDGAEVDVPGPRRRAVLALLVLAGGRTVSVDALLDAVWPEATPESGRRALHSHVSRLRGHLGPHAELLERDGHGYRLRADDLAVDALEVRGGLDDLRRAAASDPATVAAELGARLAQWRGAALEEFPDIEPLAADAVALESLRADLTDDWLEARLAAGGDPDLHRDAARAARDAPLRERTAALLVRALAAEGRQSEAMRVAHDFRRALAEETGFDPTPSFGELESLVASGALVVTTVAPSAPVAPPPPAPPPSAALAARPTAPRRRARPSTPMVGRQHELATVLRTVASAPLVTIVGPGGVGKTRLALEAAAELADAAERDVHIVELATIEDGRHTLDALGVALGLRVVDREALRDAARAVLSRGRPVLVVDNCEHLVVSCRDLVDELLEMVDELTVLATSREPLDLPQEHLIRLGPLPVPDADASLADVGGAPAIEAFVAHVRRRDPGFALTPANALAAAEVVRRLDGLPLALDLLGSGRTSADARHRTLRSTIDWSYRLLEDDERALIRALSIFPAGLDLAGLEGLAARRRTPRDAAALVARLVDASVLVPEMTTGRARFRLLETVRAFALEDAVERGERAQIENDLLGIVLEVIAVIAGQSHGPNEKDANERFSAEFPNIRAAHDVAIQRGDYGWTASLAVHLHDVGAYRDFAEAHTWALGAARRVMAGPGRPDAALVLGAGARSAWLCALFDESIALGTRALELATDDRQQEFAYEALGIIALFEGDFARSEELLLRAASTSAGRAAGSYLATAALAVAYSGEIERADALLVEARAACKESGSPSDAAFCTYAEAEARSARDPAGSIAIYEDAIALGRDVGATFVEGVATVGLAAALGRTGRTRDALVHHRWLLDYFRRAGNWTQLWTAMRNLAPALAAEGELSGSRLALAAVAHASGVARMAPPIAAEQAELLRHLDARLGPEVVATIDAQARSLSRYGVVDEIMAAVDTALG